MAELGVASLTPLNAWCRAYQEGGTEALRLRPKGRPAKPGQGAPKTREQELEERVRALEAEGVIGEPTGRFTRLP